MEGQVAKEESLRERVDSRLLACKDTQLGTEEVVFYIVGELLPSEVLEQPKDSKEETAPQGWFEEVCCSLDKIMKHQLTVKYQLDRLSKAVCTGAVKKG